MSIFKSFKFTENWRKQKSVMKQFSGYKLLLNTSSVEDAEFRYHRRFTPKVLNTGAPQILRKTKLNEFLRSSKGGASIVSIAVSMMLLSAAITYTIGVKTPNNNYSNIVDPFEMMEEQQQQTQHQTGSTKWI